MKKILLITILLGLTNVKAQVYTNPTTGYVGIGTTITPSPLTVNGSIYANGFASLNFGDNAKFPVSSSDVPSLRADLSPLSVAQYGLTLAGTSSSAELWMSGNAGLRMFTGGNTKPKFNILTNGNVGIGILNPESKLDIGTDNTQKTFINYQNKSSVTFIPNNGSWFHISTNNGSSNDLAISQGANVDQDRLLTIKNNGNIGIGVKEPGKKLEIYNAATNGHLRLSANDVTDADMSRIDVDFHISNRNQTIARIASRYENSNDGGYGGLRFLTSNAGQLTEKLYISSAGNVGIGLDNPTTKLQVDGDIWGGNLITSQTRNSNNAWIIHAPSQNNSTALVFASKSTNGWNWDKQIVFNNGNISVSEKLEAREVKVTQSPTADFVFEEDYALPKLEEVEKHIKEKKHLPEIASAKEMEKEGVNIGEFQIKLLQKIEELTLYSIEQNKKIKQLESENYQIRRLFERVEKLEKNTK